MNVRLGVVASGLHTPSFPVLPRAHIGGIPLPHGGSHEEARRRTRRVSPAGVRGALPGGAANAAAHDATGSWALLDQRDAQPDHCDAVRRPAISLGGFV